MYRWHPWYGQRVLIRGEERASWSAKRNTWSPSSGGRRPRIQLRLKFTVMVVSTSTGSLFSMVGR
jgi:hypothetical protein